MVPRKTILCILLLALTAPMFAVTISTGSTRTPAKPRAHKRHHRYVHWNPVLKGSHESLLRQNAEIDRLSLDRIEDDEQLQELVEARQLVGIDDSDALRVSIPHEDRRYCRPWTLEFLQDMSQAYFNEFGQPILVTSAVRTVEQQKKLRRHNRNAAPIEGETASSHLAGLTVDISKRGMTRKQHKWLEQYVKNLQDLGLVEAAEERRQACFHIMVSERYSDWRGNTQLAGQ